MQFDSIFPKEIKIDELENRTPQNIIQVMESSNLILGNGARTSHTAIVLAKCLHFSQQEQTYILKNKKILELGGGIGLLAIYLGVLGAQVLTSDINSVLQITQKNIDFNSKIIQGKVECCKINWKNTQCTDQCQDNKHILCRNKIVSDIDLTIVCECGGIEEFDNQIHWMGKEGMILAFMEQSIVSNEFLSWRIVEQYLLGRGLEYERVNDYHPDYDDQRVYIYRIWPKIS